MKKPIIPPVPTETLEDVRWNAPQTILKKYSDKNLEKGSQSLKDEYKRYPIQDFKIEPKSSMKLVDGMNKMYDNSALYKSLAREEHLTSKNMAKISLS